MGAVIWWKVFTAMLQKIGQRFVAVVGARADCRASRVAVTEAGEEG